jgi:hypothetical protein
LSSPKSRKFFYAAVVFRELTGATGTVPASPQAENVTVHIAVMPFSLFRAIIPAVFSDSA